MTAPALPAVVIGAGHAGLSASYFLKSHGIEHVVLEAGRVGDSWRNARWDSFFLNTPNWTLRMPGSPYEGPAPDAFLSRAEVVQFLESYRTRHALPVREATPVSRLDRDPVSGDFRVATPTGPLRARNVIVASGAFTAPHLPPGADAMPRDLTQLHSSGYRNPGALAPGAVLIVGTGQSGGQIAEDLLAAGRRVFLSAGNCPRVVRRYRGKDIVYWLERLGFFDRTVDKLPSPAAKNACNPLTSGTQGGHDIDLRALAAAGATLLGRFEGVANGRVRFGGDLHETLVKADEFAEKVLSDVDAYIEREKIAAPREVHAPPLPPVAAELDPKREIDLAHEGIRTVIWATGARPALQFLRSPALDAKGEVIHARGVTDDPGLYFVGLHFQYTSRSDLFLGVGADAEHVVSHLVARERGERGRA